MGYRESKPRTPAAAGVKTIIAARARARRENLARAERDRPALAASAAQRSLAEAPLGDARP